jgi:hypothetical protein
VTLKGRNFKDGMTVQVDGLPITPSAVSPTEIQFESPALAKCGAAQVKVLDGQQAIAGQVELRYRLNSLSLTNVGTLATVNNNTTGVVAGDFNQDGKGDLALSNGTSPGLGIALGSGNFTFQSMSFAGIGASYSFLRTADVNGAAGPDLLGVNANQVAYYSGPAFQPTATSTMDSTNIGDFAVGDINNDRHPDVVIIPRDKGPISGYTYNPATDQFTKTLPDFYSLTDQGTRVVIDDFNNDGYGDIIVGTQPDSQLNICLGQPAGTAFSCSASTFSPGSGAPGRLGSATVAADGRRLLIVATATTGRSDLIAVSMGPGNTLTTTTYASFPEAPRVLLLEDINCDGLKDLILYGNRDNLLRIHTNLGDGTFAMTADMLNLGLFLGGSAMDDVFSVGVGDLDADGAPDVTVLNSIKNPSTTTGTLFRNTGSK